MLCHILCHTSIREHSEDFCPAGETRDTFYGTIGSVHEVHNAIYSAAPFDLTSKHCPGVLTCAHNSFFRRIIPSRICSFYAFSPSKPTYNSRIKSRIIYEFGNSSPTFESKLHFIRENTKFRNIKSPKFSKIHEISEKSCFSFKKILNSR